MENQEIKTLEQILAEQEAKDQQKNEDVFSVGLSEEPKKSASVIIEEDVFELPKEIDSDAAVETPTEEDAEEQSTDTEVENSDAEQEQEEVSNEAENEEASQEEEEEEAEPEPIIPEREPRPRNTVGVLLGGKSMEHEVSITSAKNVIRALDKEKHDIVLIGIDKAGHWWLNTDYTSFVEAAAEEAEDAKAMSEEITSEFGQRVFIVPNEGSKGLLVHLDDLTQTTEIDVFFPVLHGTFGEDGTMQGLLELMNVPFVGADRLGTAVGMDKDVMKKLLIADGIPIGEYICMTRENRDSFDFQDLADQMGTPLFVKPANAGSSVGVSVANDAASFKNALDEAFRFDHKVLVEETIKGREIECAVLGNENPKASVLGEIAPKDGNFYSYDVKYINTDGAELIVPAPIEDKKVVKEIQAIAVQAFQTLCHEGMGRVDCFLTDEGEILVNEINSIPGFTNISMYPQLWEHSGISQTQLVEELIELAFLRFEKDQANLQMVD